VFDDKNIGYTVALVDVDDTIRLISPDGNVGGYVGRNRMNDPICQLFVPFITFAVDEAPAIPVLIGGRYRIEKLSDFDIPMFDAIVTHPVFLSYLLISENTPTVSSCR
jgi:hypothetical protein